MSDVRVPSRAILETLERQAMPAWAPSARPALTVSASAFRTRAEQEMPGLPLVAGPVPTHAPADVLAIRELTGLVQRRFSALLGVTPERVRELEVGGRRAPYAWEDAILHALRLAMGPMVREIDRRAWARGLADQAEQLGVLYALCSLLAAGGQWRARGAPPVSGVPTSADPPTGRGKMLIEKQVPAAPGASARPSPPSGNAGALEGGGVAEGEDLPDEERDAWLDEHAAEIEEMATWSEEGRS